MIAKVRAKQPELPFQLFEEILSHPTIWCWLLFNGIRANRGRHHQRVHQGVADIFVALIGRKKDKAGPAALPEATAPPTSPPARPLLVPPREFAPAPKPPRPMTLAPITHAEIRQRLETATPFHRDVIERSYVGMRVAWRIVFHYYSGGASTAMLCGDVADTKSHIECCGQKDDFLSLVHATDGEVIEVEGTINSVSTAYIALDDCMARRLATA